MSDLLELPRNVLLFSEALRKKGVVVTTDSVLVALRGLWFINIQHKIDFYYLLKASLVSRWEEIKRFDEVFAQFWSFSDNATPSLKEDGEAGLKNSAEEKEEEPLANRSEKEGFRIKERISSAHERTGTDEKNIPEYSPMEILRKRDFSTMRPEELEEVKDCLISFSRKVAMVLSRRWKKGKKEGRFDFGRTIRHAVRHGGEIMELRWKQRKTRPPRIVFLCDVSGSMDIYGRFLLLFMYVVQNFYPRCETLTFSTRLSRITDILKREKTFSGVLQFLSHELLDWSGGTNIGGALHELRKRYSAFLHPRRTIFLIFSDGWERGDTTLLKSEMRSLKQLTRTLIWLNPHLGSPNYKPLCKGMATALPYLDHFLPCHNLSSLRHLGNLVSTM
jgi:hypothetical protein